MSKTKEKEIYPACPLEERTVCPSHPGEVLKELYLDELHLTIGDFAELIGVSRKAVSMIVNKRKSITPEMALRLGKALDTGPKLWLNLQGSYDIWQTKHMKVGFLDKIPKIAALF